MNGWVGHVGGHTADGFSRGHPLTAHNGTGPRPTFWHLRHQRKHQDKRTFIEADQEMVKQASETQLFILLVSING